MQDWDYSYQCHHPPAVFAPFPSLQDFEGEVREGGSDVDVSFEPAQCSVKVEFSVRSTGPTL